MDEAALRRVLLVRACEETDPDGHWLPHEVRERAGREARADAGDGGAGDEVGILARRAGRLREWMAVRQAGLASVERIARLAPPLGWIVLGGLGLGLVAHTLGGARRVNLLAFPLLGLVAWNLAVVAFHLLSPLLRGRSRSSPPALARSWAQMHLFAVRLASRVRGRTADAGMQAGRTAARFAQLWMGAAGGLEASRWRLRLHAGAIALAAGVVAGMYLDGIAFAYQATWESTFLDARQVHGVLALVLGPAARLLGSPLPDVAGIAAIELPGHADAAPWIHRWAVTAALFVAIPRLALAGHEWTRALRLARALTVDLDEPYYLRLLAAGRGGGIVVRVLPYSTEFAPHTQSRLRELAHDLFGNRARVQVEASVPYGADAPTPPEAGREALLVVFNLAQSPEQEVHGEFLEALLASDARPDDDAGGRQLLVALDEARYREVASEERVDERHRTWARLLGSVGLRAIRLDPAADPAQWLGAARELLAPAHREARA